MGDLWEPFGEPLGIFERCVQEFGGPVRYVREERQMNSNHLFYISDSEFSRWI